MVVFPTSFFLYYYATTHQKEGVPREKDIFDFPFRWNCRGKTNNKNNKQTTAIPFFSSYIIIHHCNRSRDSDSTFNRLDTKEQKKI